MHARTPRQRLVPQGGSLGIERAHLCWIYLLLRSVCRCPWRADEGESEREGPQKFKKILDHWVLGLCFGSGQNWFSPENGHIFAPPAPFDAGVVALNAHSHGAQVQQCVMA